MCNYCFNTSQSSFSTTNLVSFIRVFLLSFLCFLFSVKSSLCQITEGFEEASTASTSGGTGMPSAYGTGSYVLTSGTWTFNYAKQGTTGVHGGTEACQMGTSSGSIISPNIATAGVDSIYFWASVSSVGASCLKVQVSSNGGASYTAVTGSPFTLTGTPALYKVYVHNTSPNLLVEFLETRSVIYLDDINITAANISTPVITVTGTLAAVNTTYGTASISPSSFNVSGATMNAAVLVTAPAGFEVSASSGSGYNSTTTVGTSGTFTAIPVYVRLKATTLAGTYSGNIVLTSSGATTVNLTTVSSTVNPYTLLISGLTGVNKTYDGNTTASLTGTAVLSATVNNDNISLNGTASGQFSTALVANGKTVSISGLSLSGTNSPSYILSPATTTANITALPVTISAASANNKVYDGTTAATISGTLSGIISSDVSNVVLNATGTFAQSTVANVIAVVSTATLSGSASGNYSLIQPTGLYANITKASQTINFTTFTTPVTTATTGFTLIASTSSGLTVTFVSSNTAVATISGTGLTVTGVGSTTISACQPGDTNHLAASIVTQTLVVNLAPVIIYQHGFESGNFGGIVYTQIPSILSPSLINTQWTIPTGVFQSFQGSGGAGSGSLGVLSGASSSPFTLSVNIVNGYSLTINSFSFWRQTSSSVIWSMYVNNILVGSGISPTVGSSTGTINVSNAISGLTGTVNIQLVLSGSGSFRIDDFTLNGNLISCGVLPSISTQPVAQTICATSALNLNVVANNVNTYQWRKGGVNISSATSASYSIASCLLSDAGTYDVLLTGSSYCATTISNDAIIVVNPIPTGVKAVSSDSSVCSGTPVNLSSVYSGVNENFETFPLTSFSVSGTGATMVQNNTYYSQGKSSVIFNTINNLVTNPAMTMSSDIDLTKYGSSPLLQFSHICALEGATLPYDFGFVEYSTDGGTTWVVFPSSAYQGAGTLLGSSGGICFSTMSYPDWISNFNSNTATPGSGPATTLWKNEIINLTTFTGYSKFRIRFRITTDVSNLYYGWLIDDLTIGSIPTGFKWTSFPEGYSDNSQNPLGSVSPVMTTKYIVTVTNRYGCSSSSNTTVTVMPSPAATIHYINSPFCKTADIQSVDISDTSGLPLITAIYSSQAGLTLNQFTGDISPSTSSLGNYIVNYYMEGTNGCIDSTKTSVEVNQVGLWKIAGEDEKWNNIHNWACTSIPCTSDNVFISTASAHYPLIDSIGNVHNINIDSGAAMTIAGVLNITGSVNNRGNINAASGTIEFNGDTVQNIIGGFTVNNLTINNSNGGVSLGSTSSDTVSVQGVYTPSSGVLTTNGRLVLVSTSTGTARVAAGKGQYISGNVTVQRYHSNKRAWLLMTAPLTTFQMQGATIGDIHNNWQTETYITGPDTTGGLDKGPNNNYSMLNWTGTLWGNVTNTKNSYSLFGKPNAINDSAYNKPYFLFVRGDRSILPSMGSTAHSSVVLTATGILQTGDLPETIIGSSGTYGLVANPYAAPIDLNTFRTDNSSLIQTYYYWDPNLSTTGGYVTAAYLANKWYYTNQTTGNTTPEFIQSGQAFFVSSNSLKTVSFHENQKNTDSSCNAIFGNDSSTGTIRIDLSKGDPPMLIDGVLGLYNNHFSNAVVPGEDAIKFWGNEENIALLRNGSYLSLEARPTLVNNDTMFIYLSKIVAGNTYNFTITCNNLSSNITGYLADKFSGTQMPLNLSAINTISFTVTSALGSNASDRFMIVFKNSPLSVMPIHLTAEGKAKQVEIVWSMINENGIDQYEVERSIDAINYVNINTTKANKDYAVGYIYKVIDSTAILGVNFYRIKALIQEGRLEQYSNVVKVWVGERTNKIYVYPNPVIGKSFNIMLDNVVQGNYSFSIINSSGQQVMATYTQYINGNAVIPLFLPACLPVGVYQLKVVGESKNYVEKVLVN